MTKNISNIHGLETLLEDIQNQKYKASDGIERTSYEVIADVVEPVDKQTAAQYGG